MSDHSLDGRSILLTRTEQNARTLAQMIEKKGGIPLVFPFFKQYPVDDQSSLSKIIERLDKYDIVVFVSPAAVRFGLSEILARRAWPTHTLAATVGSGTAKLLKKNGIGQIIMPVEDFCSEGLLAHAAMGPEAIGGRRVLIMRAASGRQLLAQTLVERGALVDLATCYERREVSDQMLWQLMQARPVDAVTLFSSAGLYKLQRFAQADLMPFDRKNIFALPLFTPHRRVAGQAREAGWRHVEVTGLEDAAMVESLCGFDWSCHE